MSLATPTNPPCTKTASPLVHWSTTLTLGGAGTLDGQLGVAHILLLGLDLAHLRLLGGQTALVVRSVHDAQRQERVAAELGTEIMVLDLDNGTND